MEGSLILHQIFCSNAFLGGFVMITVELPGRIGPSESPGAVRIKNVSPGCCSKKWEIVSTMNSPKPEAFLLKKGTKTAIFMESKVRSEERRVGKECRYRWSRY